MVFDPARFLEIGRFLLAKAPEGEATFRAVCGRAYYVKSDYRYSAQVARREAERALDDANWVIARLNGIPESGRVSNGFAS